MGATLLAFFLVAGCGDDAGDGGDADSDIDADTDTDTDTDTGSDTDCEAVCETLNVSDLAAADQTPDDITMDSSCESGDYEREIQNLVNDADGLPQTWTELRTYQRPDKGNFHEIRTEYTVSSRCADGRIEEMDARMHSLRPAFISSCNGVYCFAGL